MLKILFEDDWFVAIDKPPGLLVHRSKISCTETRFAMQMVRDQTGSRVYLVHRLDRPTSGVLLMAKDPQSAKEMSAAFARREVRKSYLAVVRGIPEECGTIDYSLRAVNDKREPQSVAQRERRKAAVTVFQRLGTVELPCSVGRYQSSRYALLSLRPRTGRRHQLRRHLAHISHPIIGDVAYGEGRHNRFFREKFGVRCLLLAAVQLSFQHPFRDEKLSINAPLNDDFRKIVEALGWNEKIPIP